MASPHGDSAAMRPRGSSSSNGSGTLGAPLTGMSSALTGGKRPLLPSSEDYPSAVADSATPPPPPPPPPPPEPHNNHGHHQHHQHHHQQHQQQHGGYPAAAGGPRLPSHSSSTTASSSSSAVHQQSSSATAMPESGSGVRCYPSGGGYPPAPGSGALTRDLSVESTRSHSPGPEPLRQQHVARSLTPPFYPGKDPSSASSAAAYPVGKEVGYPGAGIRGGGGETPGLPASSYPASSRELAYPTSRDRFMQSEQQHLLAYRSSPTPCCKHGSVSDVPQGVGAADYPLKRQRSTRSTRSTASRRRQNEDSCTTCLRGTLHCYNVCILIIGCAALGVGIWLLVTDFGARNVTPIADNQLYEVTTYLLIAGGGAVALLAFCGCCGTIREDKCVLSFYGTTLAIVLIVLGVACGLAFFFRATVGEHIQKRMKDTLTKKYGVDIRTNVENRRITESWDAMQRQLQCCGVMGNTSSKLAWNFYSSGTEWNLKENQKTERRRVPESCCAKGDVPLCTGLKEFKGPPLFFNNHLAEYREVNPYLYTTGCYDKLMDYLDTYSAVVGCVAAIVPLFLVLGIVVSFCLCARVAGISSDEEVEL